MNILLQSRVNLFQKVGGDTFQILQTKKCLERLGSRVNISIEIEPDLSEYDIVHLFNINRIQETYVQLKNAKRQRKPVVVTPIYQDLHEYNIEGRHGIGWIAYKIVRTDERLEKLRCIYHRIKSSEIRKKLKIYNRVDPLKMQMEVLNSANLIIFGSEEEKNKVYYKFEMENKTKKYFVIPVCVDEDIMGVNAGLFKEKYGLTSFVLSIGRIEDLKNQLSLLNALKDTGLILVLIGSAIKNHKSYYKKLLNEVEKNPNAYYFGNLDRETILSSYYAAKVHAQPSWFETTGLASLEAGLRGCNIVITNRGYAKEYFKDYAWYCDPSDTNSVQKAVIDAYNSHYKTQLREHILNNYNEDTVGPLIFEAYKGA